MIQLYDILKEANYGSVKKISAFQRWVGEKDEWHSDFWSSENILCGTISVGVHHSVFVQTHRMYSTRLNPNVKCGVWVVMMCQYRFIQCSQ